jgi:hypothetical protein
MRSCGSSRRPTTTLYSRGIAYREKGNLDQAIADLHRGAPDQSEIRPPITSVASRIA